MRSYEKSIALYERTRKSLAGGVSSNVRYAATPVPLFFARGEGARLFDVDGNVHIDYVLGNGPAILGHAPPKVVAAVGPTTVCAPVCPTPPKSTPKARPKVSVACTMRTLRQAAHPRSKPATTWPDGRRGNPHGNRGIQSPLAV